MDTEKGHESTARVNVRGPVSPSRGVLRPLGLDEVRLLPGFWGDRQELNAAVILDHCHGWMSRAGWIGNFGAAVEGRLPADRHGREFSDSEIYKLMEAFSWEAGRTGRDHPAIAELTDLIAAAQEGDGYLNTMFGHQGPGRRYRDLEWGHELYCYGHMIQAGVARLRMHGDDRFVQVVRRAADHVSERFAEAPEVCGHPEIEMALVELYRATGDDRYLEQARAFVDRRGRPALADIHLGRAYYQDDMPVREARVFRGHAVRALYLACGVVDVAVETGDDELLQTVIAQWERTIAARTYLTGGMGSRHSGEAFGEDFELPPD
ncbi:MAG: glycoside hydrolase family 127 protein, partial [Actinomadura sp.]